jgi:hypothetical protein
MTPLYTAQELSALEKLHDSGRLLPYLEFPLFGGQHSLRFLRDRKSQSYNLCLSPEDAVAILQFLLESTRYAPK